MRKTRAGQSLIEYFVILTVILAAVLSTGIIDRVHQAFDDYFTDAIEYLR